MPSHAVRSQPSPSTVAPPTWPGATAPQENPDRWRDGARPCPLAQARQHDGGDVTVTSEPGKGSVFTVRLPGGAEAEIC